MESSRDDLDLIMSLSKRTRRADAETEEGGVVDGPSLLLAARLGPATGCASIGAPDAAAAAAPAASEGRTGAKLDGVSVEAPVAAKGVVPELLPLLVPEPLARSDAGPRHAVRLHAEPTEGATGLSLGLGPVAAPPVAAPRAPGGASPAGDCALTLSVAAAPPVPVSPAAAPAAAPALPAAASACGTPPSRAPALRLPVLAQPSAMANPVAVGGGARAGLPASACPSGGAPRLVIPSPVMLQRPQSVQPQVVATQQQQLRLQVPPSPRLLFSSPMQPAQFQQQQQQQHMQMTGAVSSSPTAQLLQMPKFAAATPPNQMQQFPRPVAAGPSPAQIAPQAHAFSMQQQPWVPRNGVTV
eukprot:TRINITY_DN3713_c0_g1_i6.p1 TRINITY_DN3713_c0_g1~~TRINITY_DN3713_c0_g1_i6.p1  ORF type:complete len:413 (-),score=2.17 TRINITY_DN3713_c0_g1_i6:127-1194(-)